MLLVARAQSGDREALDSVLRSLQEPLFEHIRSIVGDSDFAKDVLQETLWLIARKLSSLRDARWFKPWSYRIATREAIHRSQSERQWAEAIRGEEIAQLATSENVDEVDLDQLELIRRELIRRELIRREVNHLPPSSRVVLRMRYLEGMSQLEIAEALEIAEGTVKSRLGYGISLLRKRTVWQP